VEVLIRFDRIKTNDMWEGLLCGNDGAYVGSHLSWFWLMAAVAGDLGMLFLCL